MARDRTRPGPLALFAAAVAHAKEDLAEGRDPEPALHRARELAADVRDKSLDDAVKDPCNRFRDAGYRRAAGEITSADLVTEGESMVAALCEMDPHLFYDVVELGVVDGGKK
jgi:hypothetical protein